jgi:hypothetical protein
LMPAIELHSPAFATEMHVLARPQHPGRCLAGLRVFMIDCRSAANRCRRVSRAGELHPTAGVAVRTRFATVQSGAGVSLPRAVRIFNFNVPPRAMRPILSGKIERRFQTQKSNGAIPKIQSSRT